MNPFFHFTKVLSKHGCSIKYFPRVLSYYIKYAIFEHWRLLERLFFDKKIEEYALEKDPIFILGYYRSGTTHIQQLLLADSQFGYMNYYQGIACNSFLISEKYYKSLIGKILSLLGVMNPAHNLPLTMNMPVEEDVAMVSSGFQMAANWGQVLPHKFKHFFRKFVFFSTATKKEAENFKKEYFKLIKKVSMANSSKRLVLKSPPNLARVEMILELFPNAKFVFIQRNCFDVFKSNQKLWKTFSGQHLSSISESETNENILWSYDRCMEYYFRSKGKISPRNIVEISFDELISSPEKVIEKIYDSFDIEKSESGRGEQDRFIREKHGSSGSRYNFSPEEIGMVIKRCERWIDYFNYKTPELEKDRE